MEDQERENIAERTAATEKVRIIVKGVVREDSQAGDGVYGGWEMKGWQAGFPRWQEVGEFNAPGIYFKLRPGRPARHLICDFSG